MEVLDRGIMYSESVTYSSPPSLSTSRFPLSHPVPLTSRENTNNEDSFQTDTRVVKGEHATAHFYFFFKPRRTLRPSQQGGLDCYFPRGENENQAVLNPFTCPYDKFSHFSIFFFSSKYFFLLNLCVFQTCLNDRRKRPS